jgi:hypothetical protein
MPLFPTEILDAYSRRYPQAWKQMEMFRQDKGVPTFVNWADWCWVPVAGAYAVVSGGGSGLVPPEHIPDVAMIHALATWRLSQGIYRFEPEMYEQIASTPMSGEIPMETLLRLPEWCVYIETPNDPLMPGFWALLEEDQNAGHVELRIVGVSDGIVYLLPIHLRVGASLADCLEDTTRYTVMQGLLSMNQTADISVFEAARNNAPNFAKDVARYVNLVLYLCADAPDLGGELPQKADYMKTKKGHRWFPAKKPKVWEAGYRVAKWLRAARESAASRGDGDTGRQVTPHVRRAHWHGFWCGPRSDQSARRFGLKWLPPIPIGFSASDLDKLIPTVKRVD